MASITVKNIPEDLYAKLKQQAEFNRRSINREIIACIENAVYSRTIDPEAMLAASRKLREKSSQYVISDEELIRASDEGRP